MDWESHFEKNPIQKIEKTVKISEIAACEQKTTTEKRNFCSNNVFSLYFKTRAKKNHAAKPLAFSLHFLFRRDQNHYSNLTSKIMKMCEQILKKRQRPNTIQILWIVKNQEHRNIASLSLQLRSYKKETAHQYNSNSLNCKNREQIFKKRQRTNTIQILWIVKIVNRSLKKDSVPIQFKLLLSLRGY